MIKYISEFSSLNFIGDWQTGFEQPECYAQPFVPGDIIRIQALSTTGGGETALMKIRNRCTGEEKEVSCTSTGVRSGEYWIVEYNLSALELPEGLYEVSLTDEIEGDEFVITDIHHNGNSCMLFKIISPEEARDTVRLTYTDRENSFDTVFNDRGDVPARIEQNDRWQSNLIMGGTNYVIPVPESLNIPVITPNTQGEGAALLGYSRDAIRGNVFIGGNYKEQDLANGEAFIVQYAGVRFFDSHNDEIPLPDGTVCAALSLTVSYEAGSQYYNDSVDGEIITGEQHFYSIFIPPTKTTGGTQYPVQYTNEYGAGASGWFFGFSMNLSAAVPEGVSKIVFTDLLITVVTAAQYAAIIAGQPLPYACALEEIPPESIFFCFRVEGGFLPSDRMFAGESGEFRDQRYTPTQLSSFPYQKKTLCVGNRHGVPYWAGKKINQLLSCSFVAINGIEHVRSQNAEPQINPVGDLYPLMVYNIDVEEKENYKTAMEYIKVSSKPKIRVFTENGTYTIPAGVTEIEVFLVGGGGAGKETYYVTRRNGGSGGQVILQTLQVTPGATYAITIGAGGIALTTGYYKYSANPGGDTSFGDLLTALGGLGGYCAEQSSLAEWDQPDVENSARGGSNAAPSSAAKANGEDGQLCPFDLSAFPELFGKKFAAGGGAGSYGYGGETGGANGNKENVGVFPATFYGSGGGGGAGYKSAASDGYQGIVIIRYQTL
jgi:hypothetical protein